MAQDAPTESEIYTALHQLVSRIDAESRMREVITKASGLAPREIQLLVDCLSMALDKDATPPRNRVHVWDSLIKVASSAKLVAQNHTLSSNHVLSENDSISSGASSISREFSVRVEVIKGDAHTPLNESLVSWAHLSHPNILPLYAIFFEGENNPSFVYPMVTNGSICDYIRNHPGVPRMPLVSDIVNGVSHMHQLDLVHGGLHPRGVLISNDGRVFITDLDTTPESRDSEPSYARYSAPELFKEDDIQPAKAADMWSFACLCYEVLSGKLPFFQIAREFKVSGAVASGSIPVRPGRGGVGGDEIEDTMWQLLLTCWAFAPEDRPVCLKVHQIILGMAIQNDRPEARPLVGSVAMKASTIDLERVRTRLVDVVGSNQSSSFRVPEHLHNLLSKLVSDPTKFGSTTTAVKQFSSDDTQRFVDFLDLLLGDLPMGWENRGPVMMLLSSIMTSAHIIPQRYKLNGVQYDTQECIAEGSFGRAHRGRGLSIRINLVTDSSAVRGILKSLPNWSHSSCPNTIPFYGVFHSGIAESPRLCVVTPLWTNGNLRNYARTLPQESRMLLISDVSNGLEYLHEKLGFCYGTRPITPEKVLISNEGRAVLAQFWTFSIFTEFGPTSSTYELRFAAPGVSMFSDDDIWSFGCLCYEVLSRKPPYHQYTEAAEVHSAVNLGEIPGRPGSMDSDIDEIDDEAWDLVTKCCASSFWLRPSISTVQELITDMVSGDNRSEAESLPGADILMLRSRADVDFPRIETLLNKVQAELLQRPLSKLVQSRTRDIAAAALKLEPDDTRTLVDFLDLALKDHISISEERSRVLTLLSRITSSTQIFPQRYEMRSIKYEPAPFAEGGFGKVYRASDQNMCIKVMAQVDPKSLVEWIKELILWAHLSHPNVLAFYGVFFEEANDRSGPRICLVSPYMKNRNLYEYALKLSPKARLPLILDVINGLCYLHGLGIVHSDLKGQNVLISNEGRGLITDFGASHILTATAAGTDSSVYSTLRFSAPEVILGGMRWHPTKESDIWSFGCLCYQVLSRRVPYHEYKLDIQVSAALARKEPPRRPGSASHKGDDESDEDEWDDDYFDEDWDTIDDQSWNLITKCCTPEPEDRLRIPAIQELITDMKVWDDRPPMKAVPGAEIFKLRLNPDIDLNHVGVLLDRLQIMVCPSESAGPQPDFTTMYNELE